MLKPPKSKAGPKVSGKTASGIEITGPSPVQEDEQAALISAYCRKLSIMLN